MCEQLNIHREKRRNEDRQVTLYNYFVNAHRPHDRFHSHSKGLGLLFLQSTRGRQGDTVNPEYFVRTKFSYPWDPRPFVRMEFLYSR